MPKRAINYSKTIIYKLVCNDENVSEFYVGSTTDFTRRKYEHKNRCKSTTDNSKKYIFILYER